MITIISNINTTLNNVAIKIGKIISELIEGNYSLKHQSYKVKYSSEILY